MAHPFDLFQPLVDIGLSFNRIDILDMHAFEFLGGVIKHLGRGMVYFLYLPILIQNPESIGGGSHRTGKTLLMADDLGNIFPQQQAAGDNAVFCKRDRLDALVTGMAAGKSGKVNVGKHHRDAI